MDDICRHDAMVTRAQTPALIAVGVGKRRFVRTSYWVLVVVVFTGTMLLSWASVAYGL